MKINGTAVLHATPEKVWDAILDPAVLAGVIPGCQALEPIGENHFGLTVSMGVAAIRGTYAGEVRLYDLTKPSQLTMRAAGSGGPGTIDVTVDVKLTDKGDGTTQLDYAADATVGGAAGGVGQRVLSSVAKKTAGLFFAAIDDVLTGKKQVGPAPAAAPAAATAPGAPGAPGAPAAEAGAPQFGATLTPAGGGTALTSGGGLNPLIPAVVGAVLMAIGVLIGARIARRR